MNFYFELRGRHISCGRLCLHWAGCSLFRGALLWRLS